MLRMHFAGIAGALVLAATPIVAFAQAPAPAPAAPPPITRTITFSEGMTVKDLADRLDVRVKDALKALLDRRLMMTINSAIDLDTAKALAASFGAEIETRSFEQEISAESEKAGKAAIEKYEDAARRAGAAALAVGWMNIQYPRRGRHSLQPACGWGCAAAERSSSWRAASDSPAAR